jgi:ATP-dependent Lon protease
MLDLLKFDEASISLTEKAITYLITEYSDEKGVRSLIRAVERMMMRINMLRISNHESMKTYEFYMDLKFPLEINETVVKKILCDSTIKEPELWRSLYN